MEIEMSPTAEVFVFDSVVFLLKKFCTEKELLSFLRHLNGKYKKTSGVNSVKFGKMIREIFHHELATNTTYGSPNDMEVIKRVRASEFGRQNDPTNTKIT